LAIGLTFVLASALSASLSTVVGHVVDRRGPYLPLIAGLVVGAPLMALLVVPQATLPLAVLMVITFGGPLTFSMIPAASLMTHSAEAVGVSLVLATTLFNLAYALGETLGAPISASVAQATIDFVPLLAIALLMLVTAAWALTHRRRPAGYSETASAARSTPSSSAAAISDISTYRAGVCSESPSTICTASPSVSADSRSATAAGSDTDHSPV
jgi:predicted MFS family arabinose efflux permease